MNDDNAGNNNVHLSLVEADKGKMERNGNDLKMLDYLHSCINMITIFSVVNITFIVNTNTNI